MEEQNFDLNFTNFLFIVIATKVININFIVKINNRLQSINLFSTDILQLKNLEN
jgi:hypothetical protein